MNKILWGLHLCLVIFALGVEPSNHKKRVCVIGAGASGLASAKTLASRPDYFEPVVFDKNSNVGGLWIYSENGTLDQHGLPVHSSVYKYMRTNAPKEIMAFPDYRKFTWKESRSCIRHETVLDYLENYADYFNIRKYIQFDTLVEKITPIKGSGDRQTTKWHVETRNLNSYKSNETVCDAIMICNGHLFKPKIPNIPGIEGFPGRVLHGHSYRRPEDFIGETVMILGASASGSDFAIEISHYAELVYLSHRHDRIEADWPVNVVQVTGVVTVNEKFFMLQDGSNITTDSFIYATGYVYDFPFLDSSSSLVVDDGYVHPLYRHIVNVEYPSMGLIGLGSGTAVNFPILYMQAQYFAAVLLGVAELPSYETMLEESQLAEGVKKSEAHDMSTIQWDYMNKLAEDGDFETLPLFYEKGLKLWVKERGDLVHFKKSNLIVLDDEHVVIIRPNYTSPSGFDVIRD